MIYNFGGLVLDIENFALHVNFAEPQRENSFSDLLIDKISQYENPLVCLSGGYDSQFMCLLLKQAGIHFTAVSYETMWGINLINSPDVTVAKNFCKKHNIEHEIIPLDFKKFLDEEIYIEYAQRYKTASPQVAWHCYFLDHVDYSNRSLIMGGDIPNFQIKEDGTVKVDTHTNLIDFFNVTIPYKEYSMQNNVKMCKDLLFYSPEIMTRSLENYVDMIKRKNVIRSTNPNTHGNYVKELYYNNILEEKLEPVLMSYTGFESLRQHFMSLTGDYDYFNNTYRSNLIFLHNKYYKETYGIVPDKSINRSIRVVIGNLEIITRIGEDLQDYIDNNDVEIINHWYLEF